MRNALIRLAPCAVFLSAFASAQPKVETPAVTGGGTAVATPVAGMGVNAPAGAPGASSLSGPSLQGGLGVQAPAPALNPAAATPVGVTPVSPVPGAAVSVKTVGGAVPAAARPGAQAPAAKAPALAPGAALKAPAAAAETAGAKGTPSASSILDTTARGIDAGRKAEAAGGDGLSVRQALDRAYDSSVRSGDVGGGSGVAGRFSTAREKVAGLVGVANNSAPADAPGLYGSAIKTAQETFPSAAAAAVTKAVLSFAARKADTSLSDLAQAAYTAAAAGQAAETRRLVKSIDKWEELLGAPGRPLISNGDRLKAGVEAALADSKAGAKGSAPRVWVVKRGDSYVAALPGSSVEKVPGLAASFALKLEALSPAPLADAYRAFAARPGVRSAVAARVALGESVPSAVLSTGWLWLKHLIMRAWSAVASLFTRALPPAEAAIVRREALESGDGAARAAGAPRLTVSRARGAFALARRAAAAHESLSGGSGAVSRIESLSAEFEAGVKRAALSPSDRLTPVLESLVSGDGGLRHWASLYAADARERGGEWKSGSGSYGGTRLLSDPRSTESGGSIILETERGDEALAAALDEMGFLVTRQGRGLRAKLDAQTISADAEEMASIAGDAAALISGAPRRTGTPAADGLSRLLADMKREPKAAAKTAASLDGTSRLSRAKTVGWVGEYEAVSAEIRSQGVRVIALRDPATGLSKFARIEPLRVR